MQRRWADTSSNLLYTPWPPVFPFIRWPSLAAEPSGVQNLKYKRKSVLMKRRGPPRPTALNVGQCFVFQQITGSQDIIGTCMLVSRQDKVLPWQMKEAGDSPGWTRAVRNTTRFSRSWFRWAETHTQTQKGYSQQVGVLAGQCMCGQEPYVWALEFQTSDMQQETQYDRTGVIGNVRANEDSTGGQNTMSYWSREQEKNILWTVNLHGSSSAYIFSIKTLTTPI